MSICWPRETYFLNFTTGMTGSVTDPVIPVVKLKKKKLLTCKWTLTTENVEFCAHYTQESNGPADQNMQWS
jgi:hypothetical protein